MKKTIALLAAAVSFGFAIGNGTGFAASPPPLAPPIAAAWFYMADSKKDYDKIPPEWSKVNFKDVDLLIVGPAGIQGHGFNFGLYNTQRTGNLATRFKWVIQTARQQNPKIRIIVSQWWGNGGDVWGQTLEELKGGSSAIKTYADSVAKFLGSYLTFAGGVDGYDIDYESENVVDYTDKITSEIRTRLDALSKAKDGRPFYVTVSPSETRYLKPAVPSLSFVNMQTYAGGTGLAPGDFTALGLKPQQLLYGICPETDCTTPSLEQVESQYTDNKLAGIHLWRLNSDNFVPEGKVQAQIYKFLHP
jgi:hypothetical protein